MHAIRNPQSAIRNPQSAIRNPQSATECVRLATATLALAAGMMAAPAHAADGVITITGEITDQTCKINGKDSPADIIVALPKISNAALKNKGDTAGATLFTISLTDCPASLSGKVNAHFEPGATLDHDSGNLYAYTTAKAVTTAASAIPANQSSASKADNVQIQLANTDGSAIKIGDGTTTHGVDFSGSDKKTATLRYLARYVKSGDAAIAAGKLVTYVQYSIAYP
ncbi:fimbrial protein [Bordetella hinzii 5132]|nr:fimbrial protein [Bordetella hinzii 5132]